jgi:hypothetical protein
VPKAEVFTQITFWEKTYGPGYDYRSFKALHLEGNDGASSLQPNEGVGIGKARNPEALALGGQTMPVYGAGNSGLHQLPASKSEEEALGTLSRWLIKQEGVNPSCFLFEGSLDVIPGASGRLYTFNGLRAQGISLSVSPLNGLEILPPTSSFT